MDAYEDEQAGNLNLILGTEYLVSLLADLI